MPKLWKETIESHRREVHDAILDTTAELAAEHGLLSVTMSQIAERTGIGRATLYKYFSDVEAILHAWHERQIAAHLDQLAEARDQAGTPGQRLDAMLATYARIQHERARRHHNAELGAFLHQDTRIAEPRRQLHDLVRTTLAEAVAAGHCRRRAGRLPSASPPSTCPYPGHSSMPANHRRFATPTAGSRHSSSPAGRTPHP